MAQSSPFIILKGAYALQFLPFCVPGGGSRILQWPVSLQYQTSGQNSSLSDSDRLEFVLTFDVLVKTLSGLPPPLLTFHIWRLALSGPPLRDAKGTRLHDTRIEHDMAWHGMLHGMTWYGMVRRVIT